jgi:hypothetical protein
MRNLVIGIIAGLLVGAGAARAQLTLPGAYFGIGNTYQTWSPSEQAAYAAGVWDMLTYATIVRAQKTTSADMTIAQDTLERGLFRGVTMAQLQAVVQKYLVAHPEEWHFGMPVIEMRAIATMGR